MIRARRVGNAVYVESYTNGSWGVGDIAQWGEATRERAAFIARQVNRALAIQRDNMVSSVPSELRRDNASTSS